jgi:hypothetical protein
VSDEEIKDQEDVEAKTGEDDDVEAHRKHKGRTVSKSNEDEEGDDVEAHRKHKG